MDKKEEKYIGYLKYSGKSVEDGFMDARKSGEALLGFDDILRFFLIKEDATLRAVDFEIPVKVKKGSWEIIITAAGVAAIWVAKDYLSATAKKAAEEGFLETGLAKDTPKLFKNAIKSAQWIIKIASHVGKFTKKRLDTKINKKTPKEIFIEIPNDNGEYLSVPKKYFDSYMNCPDDLFAKNASIIEKERILEIGYFHEGKEEKIVITENEKNIFYSEEEGEILFPELKHDQHVELEGRITKGNEKTNTIGFEYLDHVLTSRPQKGNIVDYKNRILSQQKNHIFPKVKIVGKIDRIDVNGEFKEKRPRIIFSDIIPAETENKNLSLFDEEK